MNQKTLAAIAIVVLGLVMFWPSGSSNKVKMLYNEAEATYGKEDYEGAITKYNEALLEAEKWGVKTSVIDKDFTTLANYKIAVCYSKIAEKSGDLNYYDNAIEIIEKIFLGATVPKHKEGLTYLWGHILYKQEKFEEAEPKFTELIENFPNSMFVENAYYAIGQLNYKLQNFDRSRQAFKAVLDGFPNSDFKDDAQHLIAQSFLDEQNFEQAYQEFDRLDTEEFKNYPDLQAEAMYKAAYCVNQLARYEDAIGRYTNFITKFPNNKYVTAAYFDTGSIYSRQKDYDNARVNYELAIQNTNEPEIQSEIQTAIGRTYYDEEDYANAIVAYQKLLDQYPESNYISEAKLGIADSHFYLESWSEASAAYNRVLDEHSDQTDLLAYVTYQLGETHYKWATSQNESDQADGAKGNFEIALSWYQKAVNDFPTDPVAPHALYGAIWTLNDLGRTDEMKAVAREFIDKNKSDPQLDILAAEVQLHFADMLFNDFEQYEDAAAEYAQLWDKDAGGIYEPLPKFHLLKLIAKFQEARSYYELAKPADFDEDDENAQLDQALLQKSITAYQQAIEKFDDAHFIIGVDEGRYDDFPQRTVQVEASILNKALVHEKLGEWEQGRQLYALIPATSDNFERSQLLIAQSLIKEGKITEAVDFYRQILGSLSDDNRSLAEIKLADLLRTKGDFVDAAIEYEKVVQRNPAGEFADDAQYLIGLCYYSAAKSDGSLYPKSIAAFQKVIADYGDSPNLVEAYYGMVLAHSDTKQWAKVMSYADEANTKFATSNDRRVLNKLGHIELLKATAIESQGTPTPQAQQALVASLRRIVSNTGAPEDARTRAQLKIGHHFYTKEDYTTAAMEYQKLIQMFPNLDPEIASNAQYQTAASFYRQASGSGDKSAQSLGYQNAVSAAQKVLAINFSVETMISASYTLGLSKFGLGDNQGAIAAYRQTISFEGQTQDATRQNLIYQAHSRLAELYSTVGNHADAIREYQYIINNSADADLKANSHFLMALAFDDHLKKYDDALLAYQNTIANTTDPVYRAQSYYRIGLVYETKLNKPAEALPAYESLVKEFSQSSNANIREMVADAGIRKSDLYVKLGRLDDAIAQAVSTRQIAQTKAQQIQSQYNLGSLKFDKARSLYSNKPGTDLQPYIDATRDAARSYLEVVTIAGNVTKLDKKLIPFVQNGLFQAGQLAYAIGGSMKYPEDLENCVTPLQQFVDLADQGLFPKTADLPESIQTSLVYVGTSRFELGRLQLGEDEGMSPKAKSYFETAAATFADLAKRFPRANDAATWQFQSAESFYAAQMFERAIAEYGKVHQVYPNAEIAPEAVYAISTCYSFLSEDARNSGDEASADGYLDKLFETNQILSEKYPKNAYAANAIVNLGNKFYNQGSMPDIPAADRVSLYEQAITKYRAALAIEGIDSETKSMANAYLSETEGTLAYYMYEVGQDSYADARSSDKPEDINASIAKFQSLIDEYPNTKYADLAYVRIGEAYMALAEATSDDSYYDNAINSFDLLWQKYQSEPPVDSQVSQALKYAQNKMADIRAYISGQ